MAEKNDLIEKVVSLCKRRGFVFPGSEIYGGLANSWDFGPYGAQLKKNIKDHWWRFFVESRDDMVGLDSALIMNPVIWAASGHLANFSDLKSECKKCNERVRVDQKLSKEDNESFTRRMHEVNTEAERGQKKASEFQSEVNLIRLDIQRVLNSSFSCEKCGSRDWTVPELFNLMFSINYSLVGSQQSVAYLRPETAQGIFVNFVNIQLTSRKKLPFGVGQIGKAFRNEITPGNFIFRTREFEQMEIEYFFNPARTKWEEVFDERKKEMEQWMAAVGISVEKTHAVEIPDGERAHYSQRTIDFEFEYPFGQKELFGLAYRGDYDISKHEEASKQELRYLDPETNEKIRPHVIEPTFGVDRAMLAILLSAYAEEGEGEEKRVVLKLKPSIAPVQVAVFPLLKNKPELVEKARGIFDALKKEFRAEWDDNGNVGKRYRRQDEIGTPYCVTVDFDTLTDNAVTVRDRDTMKQERVAIADLLAFFAKNLNSR